MPGANTVGMSAISGAIGAHVMGARIIVIPQLALAEAAKSCSIEYWGYPGLPFSRILHALLLPAYYV